MKHSVAVGENNCQVAGASSVAKQKSADWFFMMAFCKTIAMLSIGSNEVKSAEPALKYSCYSHGIFFRRSSKAFTAFAKQVQPR